MALAAAQGWEQQEILPQGNFLWQGGQEGPDQYSEAGLI